MSQRNSNQEQPETDGTRGGVAEESSRAESLFPRMCDSRKALLRSQGGPGAGLALSTCPVNRLTTFTSQLFRVVLLRRLHLPLPLPCATAGVAFHLTLVAITVQLVRVPGFWRICREAGGRVTTNVQVRDLDLAAPHVDDASKWSLTLPLWGQLAVDTTLVSALRADGSCRRRAAQYDGLAAEAARLRKVRTVLNLSPPQSSLGGLVVGHVLSRAEARGETQLMRRRAEQGWRLRWGSILACCGSGCGVHHVGAAGKLAVLMATCPLQMTWSGSVGSPVWPGELDVSAA